MAVMNRSAEPASRSFYWLMGAFALLAGAIAVSNESLWIDEGHTAYKATRPDWPSFATALVREKGSDVNMPLYMAFVWLWDKAVGSHPEWLLRASNLLWYGVLQVGMWAALRSRPRLALWSVLAMAVSPFVWFYLNEARPYVMQLAGAGLVTAFFVRRALAADAGILWTAAFGFGLLVLCGSSMLGVLWAGSAVALLGWFWWRRATVFRGGDWAVLGCTMVLLAALGAYYLHAMIEEDTKPTIGETGILNVAFSFYELFGISGLGPWRYAIRTQGLAAFRPYLPQIVLGGVVLGGLPLVAALRFWREKRGSFWPLAICWVLPIVALFAFGRATHARVLGRHLAPALPALVFLFAAALQRLWVQPRGRIFAVCAILVSAGSACSFRFAPRHAKDDIRAALAAASEVQRQGGAVWWSAGGDRLLEYCGATFHKPAEAGSGLVYLRNVSAAELAPLPFPEAVFLARPDIFDAPGAVRGWLDAHHYVFSRRWQGLEYWQKSGGGLENVLPPPFAPGN